MAEPQTRGDADWTVCCEQWRYAPLRDGEMRLSRPIADSEWDEDAGPSGAKGFVIQRYVLQLESWVTTEVLLEEAEDAVRVFIARRAEQFAKLGGILND